VYIFPVIIGFMKIDFLVLQHWFLARLYEVYGKLSHSPKHRRLHPCPDFRLKFWCSKIFFTITFSFLKVWASICKYMCLIINHILCESFKTLAQYFQIYLLLNLNVSFKILFLTVTCLFLKVQVYFPYHLPHLMWLGSLL
jgi:hypothetical protein